MERNNKILIYSLINITTILFISCFGGNNKDDNEYIYVDWTPNNENIAGLYLLNIEDHKNLSKKDSFYLKLGKDNSFTTKIFFTLNLDQIALFLFHTQKVHGLLMKKNHMVKFY